MLRYLLPKSLFGRGLLIVALPIVLIQMVAAYFFFDRHWDNVTKHMTLSLAGEIELVSYLMTQGPESRRDMISEFVGEHLGINVRYHEGQRIKHRQNFSDYPDLQAELSRTLSMPFTVTGEDNMVVVRIQLAYGVLTLKASNKRLESPTTAIFVWGMTGASLLFLCIALLFLRNQVRPIKELAEVAERFGKGRDIEDYKPSGALEVRRAGRAFLIMRERIQRQIRTRTDMLAGISHDLRTPLTRMKLQLAMLGNTPDIRELSGDVAQMEEMITEYLDFARGQGAEETLPVELCDLLKDIKADYERTGHVIGLTCDTPIAIELRINAFRRVMHNLIDNALRYGKHCAVSVRFTMGKAEILVDDDGPGIPAEKRIDAFRPFNRLDAARNLNIGGVGLGLTIARDIVQRHGGNISLDDSPMGGLRVVVRLPI